MLLTMNYSSIIHIFLQDYILALKLIDQSPEMALRPSLAYFFILSFSAFPATNLGTLVALI
jgi:hypothetical protein